MAFSSISNSEKSKPRKSESRKSDHVAPPAEMWQSSIGKKILTGVTGLGLVTFVVIHALGNLTLFFSAPTFNYLAYVIERLRPLLYLVEFSLLGLLLIHIAIGIRLYVGKRSARRIAYTAYESAGAPSRQTLASRTMIFSGLLLGVFLIWHLATFKFGPVYRVPGSTDRDMARLVFETFQQPIYTASYVIVLGFLGLHLRHGFWSALHSLGVATKPSVFMGSDDLGRAISIAIKGLPIAIYFGLLG